MTVRQVARVVFVVVALGGLVLRAQNASPGVFDVVSVVLNTSGSADGTVHVFGIRAA